jgi:putative ABC transport system permease protein
MSVLRFAPLVFKQVIRHRVRTMLTLLGIATAMFLFTSVQAMQRGVAQATQATAADTRLVVYRKDRFCPATSALPQDYAGKIARIEGVRSVVPVKIVVTNCRTSLDVVTFRGVPKESFLSHQGKRLRVVSGSIDDWMRRTDASLLGRTLADRRGLKPGMTFDAAGITTYVAAVVESDDPQDQNAAYTALEFVQLAGRNQLGIVTQFNVQVTDAAQLEHVAAAIDELFASAQEPTATTSEKAFIARVAHDIVELVGFARWLGIGCLIAVLALVGNAIVLSVQSRVAEHAILQTLGFTPAQVAMLIVGEGVVTAMLGGLLGAAMAIAVAQVSSFALSVEGQSIPILATPALLASGLAICTALGVAAGLAPAWQAGRREIVACFRTV